MVAVAQNRGIKNRTESGYVYNEQGQLVGELDFLGNLKSRFVYASQAHSPDYMIQSGVSYKFVKDHLGSVRLVVNSSSGAVAQRLDYDEWGVVTSDTSPGFQPFGFAGGLYDHQTGLVRFGARDYDAEIGRWTAKDPVRFDGGMNLYGYVGNDPVNLVDPSGKLPPAVWTGIAGGFVGLVTAFRNSKSCTGAGRALDVLMGTAVGFASGFLAGVGVNAGSLFGSIAGALGGLGAGAGTASLELFGPSGDELLGVEDCACKAGSQ